VFVNNKIVDVSKLKPNDFIEVNELRVNTTNIFHLKEYIHHYLIKKIEYNL
jgi:hypothetical protein